MTEAGASVSLLLFLGVGQYQGLLLTSGRGGLPTGWHEVLNLDELFSREAGL